MILGHADIFHVRGALNPAMIIEFVELLHTVKNAAFGPVEKAWAVIEKVYQDFSPADRKHAASAIATKKGDILKIFKPTTRYEHFLATMNTETEGQVFVEMLQAMGGRPAAYYMNATLQQVDPALHEDLIGSVMNAFNGTRETYHIEWFFEEKRPGKLADENVQKAIEILGRPSQYRTQFAKNLIDYLNRYPDHYPLLVAIFPKLGEGSSRENFLKNTFPKIQPIPIRQGILKQILRAPKEQIETLNNLMSGALLQEASTFLTWEESEQAGFLTERLFTPDVSLAGISIHILSTVVLPMICGDKNRQRQVLARKFNALLESDPEYCYQNRSLLTESVKYVTNSEKSFIALLTDIEAHPLGVSIFILDALGDQLLSVLRTQEDFGTPTIRAILTKIRDFGSDVLRTPNIIKVLIRQFRFSERETVKTWLPLLSDQVLLDIEAELLRQKRDVQDPPIVLKQLWTGEALTRLDRVTNAMVQSQLEKDKLILPEDIDKIRRICSGRYNLR